MAPAQSFADSETLFNFVVRDGNGVKGMVDSGLSKVPPPYVQPQEERIDKRKSAVSEIPPMDLSKIGGPEHEIVAEQIVSAAETLGFFQVVNHGVPVALLEKLKGAAHRFFELPAAEKAAYRNGVSPTPLVKYGTSFVPDKEKALEWKDYVSMIYTNDIEAMQFWPRELKEECLNYLKSSKKMARDLLEVLIGRLGATVDIEATIEAITGMKMVNMNYYPTCPNPELTVGVGRHSDLGTLTILLQDGIGGLYVKIEQDIGSNKMGDWMEIPPVPGALVINVGDTLQILSNGRYKSAEHRVRTTSQKARVSVPIFMIPKETEKIGPLAQVVESDGVARYKEIVFKDYMNNFFTNAHDGKKSLDFAGIL